MDENALEFATMQELVDEIQRRCVAFVLITSRDVDDRKDVHDSWFNGGFANAVGLLEITKAQFTHDYVHQFNRG